MSIHPDAGIVGREAELATLNSFLDEVSEGPVSLVFEGEAGMGKTTLLRAALDLARERSYRVLACRPAESEAKLSFAALGDLLAEVPEEALESLPEPQARALDVALLRAEPEGAAPDRRGVSVAVLGTIRALARTGPVIVAVDDAQWLDSPTAGALEFALRRLERDPVGILVAVRPRDAAGALFALDRLLPEDRLRRLAVEPLEVDALGHLLRARLGEGFLRPTLVRLHQMSGGNPFFALEIARAALRGERPATGQLLPVPQSLRELVRQRLAAMPTDAQEALLVTSALSNPTVALVEEAMGGGEAAARCVASALDAGVVEIEGGRVTFTHPLFGSVVYSEATSEQRRDLQRRLAEVAVDVEERARHLALAVEGADPDVAAVLDEAARRAHARGAPDAAAELSEMALRLTPEDRVEDRRARSLRAAARNFAAGNTARARALLEGAVELSPVGPDRAEALRRLGGVRATQDSWPEARSLFERALEEAGEDAALRGSIEQGLGYAALFTGDLAGAEEHARAALELAERAGEPAPIAEALQFAGYLEFVLGRGIRSDLMDRAVELERATEESWVSNVRPTFTRAQLLKYADRFDEARSEFTALLDRAAERGQEHPIPVLHYHLAELECWAGNWEAAARHAEESLEAAVQTGMAFYRTMALYASAVVDAHRGRIDAARDAATEGVALAESVGAVTTRILNLSVLGFLGLFTGNPGEAHVHLGVAADLVASMGVEEPGLFRFVPDEVEALVALGRLDEASSLLGPFEERAARLDRAWPLATAARCRGLLLAASGDIPGALDSLGEAVARHERVPEPFALARTLFALGRVLRRAKLKAEARESFEGALAIYNRLGAGVWAERAGREVRRVGVRAPGPFELTPTEERVASLVVQGQTNQQVADALFMSVNTVEWNLGKIYRKLGVRSRTELAARLGPGDRSG